MKRIRMLGIAGLLVIFAVGCSSTAKVETTQALAGKIDHNAIAALSVEAHQQTQENTGAMRVAVQRLKGQLFGRLVSEGVFRQVVHAEDSGKYELDVKLLSATEVSQGARIFLGVLAGSNALVANVTLRDVASGQTLTSFQVTGESASHPLSSENDMDDAIREVVDQIILALQ